MAWGKAGSTTTASAGDSFDVTVSSNETNMLLRHITSSGNTVIYNRFNSDSGSNYAYRWSENGVTDGTGISQSSVIYDTGGDAGDKFDVGYICNISSEEKLVIGFQINEDISGAGNAPVRGEAVWKWSNTSDSVTSVNTLNTAQSGDYETGSNISVLGSDLTPSAGKPTDVQVGSRFEETDTRKMYHYESPSVTYETDFSTTTNWTKTGTAQDITGGELAMQAQQGHGIQAEVYDLGTALSDSAWTIKFKIHCTSFTTSGAPSAVLIMGMSSISTGNNLTAQDFIGCRIETSASLTPVLRTQDTDGASIPDTWDASSSYAFAAADTRYIQLTRLTSTSFSIKIYSDSTYSTLVETVTGVCASGITGLRYFSVEGYSGGSANSSTFVGEMDDLKIYNGVTSTDKVWSEEGT